MTYGDSTTKLYVDGDLKNTSASVPSLSTNGANSFKVANWSSNYGEGKISNVKVYNRTLSSIEIQQNYNATKGRFI